MTLDGNRDWVREKEIEIDNLRVRLIEQHIMNYIEKIKRYDVEMEDGLWNKAIQKVRDLSYNMIFGFDLNGAKTYITIAQYNYIYKLKYKMASDNIRYLDEQQCLNLIQTTENYAKNRIKEAIFIDPRVYKNIQNEIENSNFGVELSGYLHEYSTDIEEYILENKDYCNLFECIRSIIRNSEENKKNKNTNKKHVGKSIDMLIRKYIGSEYLYDDEEGMVEVDLSDSYEEICEEVEEQSRLIINDGVNKLCNAIYEIKDVSDKISFRYFDTKQKGWHNRRKKGIYEIYEGISMIYVVIRCRQLINDFLFINQYNSVMTKEYEDIEGLNLLGYEHISKKYYEYAELLNEFEKEKAKSLAYKRVTKIKTELLLLYPRYTLEHIDIGQLNILLKIIKDNQLYEEVISIKEEIQYNQYIMCDRWNEFEKKLREYSNNLSKSNDKLIGYNIYYKTQIDDVIGKVKRKIDKIEHAVLISDLERAEKEKILKAEYEAMILVVKYLLTNEQVKREEVENA